MKVLITFLLLIAFASSGCDKSEVNKASQVPTSVAAAVKTGNWMVEYFESTSSVDMGATFIKFESTGSLVATKDGVPYNGSWKEADTNGSKTLTINITTNDEKLQKTNKTWDVTAITEYFINLKDNNASTGVTAQLMKH